MSLRDMVTDRAFLGFWRLEKIAGRAFLGERVLPLLGFPVTLFGSAKRRWENVRRQAQLDHVIAVVKHKTIRETADPLVELHKLLALFEAPQQRRPGHAVERAGGDR